MGNFSFPNDIIVFYIAVNGGYGPFDMCDGACSGLADGNPPSFTCTALCNNPSPAHGGDDCSVQGPNSTVTMCPGMLEHAATDHM